MKEVVVLILVCGVTLVSAIPRGGIVKCFDDGTNYRLDLTVLPNDDATLRYVVAIEDFKLLWNNCSSSHQPEFYTFNATGLNEFEISIYVSKSTLETDKPCGGTNLTADGSSFQWKFMTAKIDGGLDPNSDVEFVVICDFNAAFVDTASTGNITIVSEFIGSPGAADTTKRFVLELVNAGGTPVTTVALGDMVSLQISSTLIKADTSATGVTGFSCRAVSDQVFTKQLPMLSDRGCSEDVSIIPAGFVKVAGLDSQPLRARTAEYEQFKFVDSNTIIYECTVHACVDDDNLLCDDYCTNKPLRRKRSDDGDGETEQRITASITLVRRSINPEHAVIKNPDEPPTKETEDIPSCLTNTGIIGAFASMGALLVATIAVAATVCVRSLRQEKHTH